MDSLDPLSQLDQMQRGYLGAKRCNVHRDHRWVLPMICWAQEKALLPKPCSLLMFDRHHDAAEPLDLQIVKRIRRKGVTVETTIELCNEGLKHDDGDWVRAGMELGLIDHAAIFGVYDPYPYDLRDSVVDHTGTEHRLWVRTERLRSALAHDGLFWHSHSTIPWDILGWHPKQGCLKASRRVLLSLDLDYFTSRTEDLDYVPWTSNKFQSEFAVEVPGADGWSGQSLMYCMLQSAGLVTIAREPDCCGGEEEADSIFERVQRYVFAQKWLEDG